jgi:hypothetical protein
MIKLFSIQKIEAICVLKCLGKEETGEQIIERFKGDEQLVKL